MISRAVLSFLGVGWACWAYPEYAVPLFLGLTAALETTRNELGKLNIESTKLDREIEELRAEAERRTAP